LGHDPRYYFEKYSLRRILELSLLKISFRGVISYKIQAKNIILGVIFCVLEMFLGHDLELVMTEMGHDPKIILGHDRDPIVTTLVPRLLLGT
jgi:hypothetical protein